MLAKAGHMIKTHVLNRKYGQYQNGSEPEPDEPD